MKSPMQQAADKVRQAIKKAGENPRGLVSAKSCDYFAEITVNLCYINYDARVAICEAIDQIDDHGMWSWDVQYVDNDPSDNYDY